MPFVLEPSWQGRRVSVRRVVGRGDGGRPLYGDVVGDLVHLEPTRAVIETRAGTVEVATDTITIAKPAPPSTADELALEAVAARNLRAAETAELGGWLLRADHGFTRRANSVLPLRQPGRPLEDALADAHEWYAARGLPLRIHVPVEGRRLLDAALGELGWPVDVEAHVLVRRIDEDAFGPDGAPPVALTTEPDDAWLSLYRGGAGASDTARALLTRHDQVAFATLRVDGEVAAIGRGAVDSGWLGVMAIEVAPPHRRQGLAAAVMGSLARWGAGHGATRSYLQVEVDNGPALALYDRLGYWNHHDYRYRTEPQPG
jgi:GNAT superfamily N-acetyltransferase